MPFRFWRRRDTSDPPPDVRPYPEVHHFFWTVFVPSPTRDNYLAVARQLMALPSYDPLAWNPIPTPWSFYEKKRWADLLLETKRACARGWLLHPSMHLCLADAYKHLGEHRMEANELKAFCACVDGILSSGDGSAAAPYRITHTSDEWDIVTALGRRVVSQALTEYGDRLELDDGTVWYFNLVPCAPATRTGG